jgi:hypothetical protein
VAIWRGLADQQSHLVSKCVRSNPDLFWIRSFIGWLDNKPSRSWRRLRQRE